MEISKLSSVQLTRLIRLIKQKEAAQAKVEKIEHAISSIGGNGAAPKPGKRRGRKPGRPPGSGKKNATGRKRGKRLREPLLKALKAAGPEGIKVKDLASKLKVKPGNIFSWFYTTGKKVKGITKVGEARYALAS